MKFFYHHVGQLGADEDFPKTIYKRLSISLVETSVPDENPYKEMLLESLRSNFPSGYFNCWGVPSGANFVIRNLSYGDYVLLVENVKFPGFIPVLCDTRVYINHEYNNLSNALWGSHKYPFIFFFEAELLDFTWQEFLSEVGFADQYNPRGQFLSVRSDRLSKYGGAMGYANYIRKKYGRGLTPIIFDQREVRILVEDKTEENIAKIRDESFKIKNISLSLEPSLTGESKETVHVKQTARDHAFRVLIKELYRNSCAICGSNLLSPDGIPEAQSAHIYPKAKNGSDDLRNGISLCRLHHWAFDCGWISLSDDLYILVSKNIPADPSYDRINNYKGKQVSLPRDDSVKPHPIFLSEHRKLHGFE